jgi:predicted nucleic acid-binding protein
VAATSRLTLALDSGALIALSRGDQIARSRLRAWVTAGAYVIVPAPVLAETLRGKAQDAAVNRVVNATGMEPVPVSPEAGRLAGAMLGEAGARPSATIDALIAACAIEHGATDILTADDDLRRLAPQLNVIPL